MRAIRPRFGKPTALVALLLHLLVAAVGPVVDGSLEATTRPPDVHIEAEGNRNCLPAHDLFHCQVCQILGHTFVVSARVVPAFAVLASTFIQEPAVSADYAPPAPVPSLGPRAPPLS